MQMLGRALHRNLANLRLSSHSLSSLRCHRQLFSTTPIVRTLSGTPTYQDTSVKYRELNFFEEPLGLSVDQGYGYLQVDFGERIGPNSRYEILRKLGWGMNVCVARPLRCVSS